MSELGDYRRLVERPMIDGYEATITSLRSENERLQESLQQIIDYVKDGCPDDARYRRDYIPRARPWLNPPTRGARP